MTALSILLGISLSLSLSLSLIFFRSADLRQTAATIATVEARHASYLNLIQNIVPFPDTFDTALTPIKIIGKITPFIVSCPYDNLPLPRVVIIADSAGTPGKNLFVSVTLICLLLAVCL